MKHIYPGSKHYSFQTSVKMYDSLDTLKSVTLLLDPDGLEISISWDIPSNIVTKSNDLKDYIIFHESESGSENDGVDTWRITFALEFNWSYPAEKQTNAQMISESTGGYKDFDIYLNVFVFENDLEFEGQFKITDSKGMDIEENSWIPALETLTCSGLTVIFENSIDQGAPVYPDLTDLMYRIQEETSGNFWQAPVEPGEPLEMEIISSSLSTENVRYKLTLIGLPSNIELISNIEYVLNVDAEPLLFYDYVPSNSDSIFESTKIKCGVSLEDKGGSGVDLDSIEYAMSIHGTLNYGKWISVNSDQIKISTTGNVIDVSIELIFNNGTDNYVKWRARDNAGNGDINGYYESLDTQIKIDVSSITYYSPQIVLDYPKNHWIFEYNEEITFSAIGTYDPDNEELSYLWTSNISGELSTEEWFQLKLEPGVHLISLQVYDGQGHSASTSVEITVLPEESDVVSNNVEDKQGLVFDSTGATAGTATCILIILVYFFGGTEVGKYKLLGFAIPLYSKLTKKMVLDHETRGIIRGYILANPGDHFTSIKNHIGLKNGTLAYHLKILERENLIKSHRDGIFKRFYPMNVKISKDLVHMSKQEIILNTIIENPGVTRKDLANMIGLSRQVVNYHSKGLIQAGLIRSEKYGKKIQYYANEPISPDINQ
ncbi:MAG: winged helix-turn-helix transcriptional regulator [Thermoplasmata archaeon]|nr:MAG: winged helix-turn-helix transcriptional regulator [Thermoplasmata archaeon]